MQKYQNMIKILQSVDCTVFSPTKDKLRALESFYGQYEVHTLCEALDVPRGTFYNHILRGKHGETINAKRRDQLRELVNDIFHEYQMKKAEILSNKSVRIAEHFIFCHRISAFL